MNSENLYTPEFFEELFYKLNLKEVSKKYELQQQIFSAGEAYLRWITYSKEQLPAHKIQKELEKTLSYIQKAQASINKVHASGNYNHEIADSFYNVIDSKYLSLESIKNEIRDPDGIFIMKNNPEKTDDLLFAMSDGIKYALKHYPVRKTMTKSRALNYWIMILSAKLEPIIGHKLEQSRYHKGKYISKREISDSELLKFIIEPIDPNVTISQIETAIKETRKDRHTQKIF
ncbi:MAG: hypothetical protein H6867_01170 [Rhodospirillales bacterium]|nr:hypothetical protein [Rhodospirillales bacterium]MCB9997126.1 hypothetical protein [Rhodospirillales bacterium]